MASPVATSEKIAKKLDKITDENQTGIHQAFMQNQSRVIDTANPDFVVQPAKYFEKDGYDDMAQLKRHVAESLRSDDPIEQQALGTHLEITDKDLQYLLDQRKKEELFDYDQWFYNTYQFGSDPNKIMVAKQINPGWFSRRSTEISHQIEIAKKMAKLALRGPRSETEVMTLYALDQGRIKVPDLDLLFPEKAKTKLRNLSDYEKLNRIDQGYFNPKQYSSTRKIYARQLTKDNLIRLRPDVPGALTTKAQPSARNNPQFYTEFFGRMNR